MAGLIFPRPTNLRDVGEREVINHGYIVKEIPGRGNGLVATRDFAVGEQIMFINRPVGNFVSIDKLDGMSITYPSRQTTDWNRADTCHQCFRTAQNTISGSWKYIAIGPPGSGLKFCTGCYMVKYCSEQCRKAAWKQHHKYECSVFRGSSLQELSNENAFTDRRAVLRILLLRKHGILSDTTWKQILNLETHFDEALLDHERGPRLMVDSLAFQRLTGNGVGIDKIVQVMCAMETTKFSSSYPASERQGTVFDPEPALINHSCTPNATIRTDVSKYFTNVSSPDPIIGSISVHAEKPIVKGDEILHAYVPTKSPTSLRQSSLRYTYFFTCSCVSCQIVAPPMPAHGSRVAAISLARLLLEQEQGTESIQLSRMVKTVCNHPDTGLAALKLGLAALARESHSISEYPMPQLRKVRVGAKDFELQRSNLAQPQLTAEREDLVIEYLIMYYRLRPWCSDNFDEFNSIRWRLFCWVWFLAEDSTYAQKIPGKQLSELVLFLLHEIAQDLLSPEQSDPMAWAQAKVPEQAENKGKTGKKASNSRSSQGLLEIMVLERMQNIGERVPQLPLAKKLSTDNPDRASLQKWIDVVTTVALAKEKRLPTEGVVSGGPPFELDSVVAHELRKLCCLSMVKSLKQMNVSK
jgi:hypothetical protein